MKEMGRNNKEKGIFCLLSLAYETLAEKAFEVYDFFQQLFVLSKVILCRETWQILKEEPLTACLIT